jgi:hypothetical protein
MFAEVELNLRESGELYSYLTHWLTHLPLGSVDLDSEESTVEVKTESTNNWERKFEFIERLQCSVRDHRRKTGYWFDLMFSFRDSDSLPYFVGWCFLKGLWLRWQNRCPALSNSSLFYQLLLMLTSSEFDDLIPDWRKPVAEFRRELLFRMRNYLRRLAAVTPEQLARAVESIKPAPERNVDRHTPTVVGSRIDWWRFFRTGRLEPSDRDGYLRHASRFQAELAATIRPVGDDVELIMKSGLSGVPMTAGWWVSAALKLNPVPVES